MERSHFDRDFPFNTTVRNGISEPELTPHLSIHIDIRRNDEEGSDPVIESSQLTESDISSVPVIREEK